MRAFRWAASIFEGPEGEASSKRIMAFGFVIASLWVGIVKGDAAICTIYASTATLLLGVAAVTKT